MVRLTKKVFFAPAVIAALNLLALAFLFRQMPKETRVITAIKQFLPSEDSTRYINGYRTLALYENRTPLVFALSGNETDLRAMQAIKLAVTRMNTTPDTSKYIKVSLSDEIQYHQVVALIDMMITEGHKRYAFWKNDFYILPPPINEITVKN